MSVVVVVEVVVVVVVLTIVVVVVGMGWHVQSALQVSVALHPWPSHCSPVL
jgi:hypothetical protein